MINSQERNNQADLAQVLDPTEENIQKCAAYIKQGGIVGMPTETVYGLAANAFDVAACEKIFLYKGRPLTDPLIVHVSSMEMAESITLLDKEIKSIFNLLSGNFWPGPLTIVLKANLNKLSRKILAGSDTVGIRFPLNEIAQKLIKASGVPIAAPSANKFCHISPVNPYHVFRDFREFPVMILNGGVCNFCMESTVIKINQEEKKIIVCRMGAVSPDDINNVLSKSEFKDYTVECLAKKAKVDKKLLEEIAQEEDKVNHSLTINQEAPGQFLKHYSPKLQTFLYSGENDYVKETKLTDDIIFIDYQGTLKKLFGSKISDENFLELSDKGDSNEVMKNLYDYLHQAEQKPNKKMIIICDLEKFMKENSHKLTLLDRMWKAASFKKIKIIDD